MKKILINSPILDLNDLPIRYIGADKEIHNRTFGDIIGKCLSNSYLPIAKTEHHISLCEAVNNHGNSTEPLELTDEQFAIVCRWVRAFCSVVIAYRWDKMVEQLNP